MENTAKTEMRKVETLIPYINNPRNNDAAVDAVASSIKNFGFKVPIVIDAKNEIINGHTRLKAAKKLGLTEVPVIVADDLTPEQVKAFRLADNKVSELATWDDTLLSQELEELQGLDFDMSAFGFEVDDLKGVSDVEEDDYDEELPQEPKSKAGELYQLGNHRLIVGDSTSEADITRLMNGEQLDLLVTDPPYNVAYEGSDGKTIQNDNMGETQFLAFLTDAFKAANNVMRPGAAFYIWHASREVVAFETAVKAAGWTTKQMIVWVKNSFAFGRSDYHWQHEPCLYGWKDGAAHYFIDDRTQTTVIEDKPDLKKMSKAELIDYIDELKDSSITSVLREDKPLHNDIHPTMKPLKLISRLVLNSSKPNENVGDFFGGSGSTLMACEQLGRRCFTCELDPRYADAIINRWETFTGRKAIKLD